jgi:WD40 repeat protein
VDVSNSDVGRSLGWGRAVAFSPDEG